MLHHILYLAVLFFMSSSGAFGNKLIMYNYDESVIINFINEPNCRIKIYLNVGEGYSEKNSSFFDITLQNGLYRTIIPVKYTINNFRIDFENWNGKKIEINSMEIQTNEDTTILKGTALLQVFRPNKYILVSSFKNHVSFRKKELSSKSDPYLIFHRNIFDKIRILKNGSHKKFSFYLESKDSIALWLFPLYKKRENGLYNMGKRITVPIYNTNEFNYYSFLLPDSTTSVRLDFEYWSQEPIKIKNIKNHIHRNNSIEEYLINDFYTNSINTEIQNDNIILSKIDTPKANPFIIFSLHRKSFSVLLLILFVAVSIAWFSANKFVFPSKS